MKVRKYFVLVQENLQTSFYKTEKYTMINLDKNPNQKKFIFQDEKKAQNFISNVQSCKSKEAFEKLEMDYQISQQLIQYEQKIKSCKTFSENESEEGVYINLRRLTYIYILWKKDSYEMPRIYFSQVTAKKNSTQEDQLAKLSEPEAALNYIRDILETIAKKKKLILNRDNNQSDNQQEQNEFNKEKEELNFSNLGKLQQLDQQYSYLFSKFFIDKYQTVNINPELQYAIQCSYFITMHFHSSIGISLINYISGESLKSQGIYVGHQKPYVLGLLSALYGLRYCIFLDIPSITLQITKQKDFEFLNKMIQPSYPQQQLAMAAIESYSKLLKQVNFELVDQEQGQESFKSAVKEFERYANLKERSKKFRKFQDND
ncbi:unnamed protein product [Paramecium sonneborni]|uniref:Uncharacterized protein n=1 Tax=Paramecium sonneborni TaxID=65129 RepID=A0A8S1QG18_9CILI|nr:unnamed protein product [Paramecium sonneborni]